MDKNNTIKIKSPLTHPLATYLFQGNINAIKLYHRKDFSEAIKQIRKHREIAKKILEYLSYKSNPTIDISELDPTVVGYLQENGMISFDGKSYFLTNKGATFFRHLSN